MKHFEVLRKWCKKIEIDIFDKWLISLDHVTEIAQKSQTFIFYVTDLGLAPLFGHFEMCLK